MRVLIIGAAGFVGSRLVDRILEHAAFAQASVTLSDTEFKTEYSDRRVHIFPGDLRNVAVRERLMARGWCSGRRVFTLPAQRVSMSALIEGLTAQFPTSHSIVGFAPELELEAQFARQPPLTTTLADELGFKHDGTIGRLIIRAMQH